MKCRVTVKWHINKLSSRSRYLMKGMATAVALWEYALPTQILTLEWRSDAMCGKKRRVCGCGCAVDVSV